jgi:uncharacterized protein (TIGR02118 family)
MMMKVIVLYPQPADPLAFKRYFNEIHVPIARKIPGLQRLVANWVVPGKGGADHFLISELHFADRAALGAAMKSPENGAAGEDVAKFATGKVQFLVAEVVE